MQSRLIAAVLFLGLVLCAGGALAAESYGKVCGYSWDVLPHEIAGSESGNSSKLLNVRTVKGAVEMVAGAPASEAAFAFSKTGLYAVFARPVDTASYNVFMDAMLEKYGNPVITQVQGVKFYVWERGELKVKIMRDLERDKRAVAFYRADRAQQPYQRKYEEHADELCGYIPKVANIPAPSNSIIKF